MLRADALGATEREELFQTVAMVLPTVFRDQPYPEDLGAAREAVYGGAGPHQAQATTSGKAEHFAARMEARVMETTVEPPAPAAALGEASEALDAFAARMASAGATAVQVLADDVVRDGVRAVAAREFACERLEDDVLPALREAGLPVVVDPQVSAARYQPDPRPVRQQTGPAQDAVVVSSRVSDPSLPTRTLVAEQVVALEAVCLAAGQRGRVDRPEARKVASQLAGRTSCPAAAQHAEFEVGGEFARLQCRKLWPAEPGFDKSSPTRSPAGARAEEAAAETSKWVNAAVKVRDTRLDEALVSQAPAPPSPPVSRGALPPVGARPPVATVPDRGAAVEHAR